MFPLNLVPLAPWLLAAALGFGFGVQTHRLDNVKLKFSDYKVAQQEEVQRQITVANKQREESSREYQEIKKQLEVSIKDGEVFKRCVAAGKCGVRYVTAPSRTVKSLSPASRVDAASADSVPVAGEPASEVADVGDVVTDCARTTLQLNMLQADVEKQEGYSP